MFFLPSTSHTIKVITTTTAGIDVAASWADKNGSTVTSGATDVEIVTATTTTVVAAPAASTERTVRELSLRNVSATASNNCTIVRDNTSIQAELFSLTIPPKTTVIYRDGTWSIYDSTGFAVTRADYAGTAVAKTSSFFKSSTATEAAGESYWYSKDAGFPQSMTVGTPGLAGRTVTSTEAGSITLPSVTTGIALSGWTLSSGVANRYSLVDLLWINSGIVVTTTTAQTINSVALPARDVDGTSNGNLCFAGILVTAAATNAAAIANTTISYTNQAGTAGRTGTLQAFVGLQIAATPVIGTFVPFTLAAGDTGVQSIQSITLGTSLLTGSISLVIYRVIDEIAAVVVQVGANGLAGSGEGTPARKLPIRIYTTSALFIAKRSSATTADVISGSMTFADI